eukprot:7108036-Pyramimonas_sp.AAC.1
MNWSPVKFACRVLEWPDQSIDARGYLQLRGTDVYHTMMRLIDNIFRHSSEWSFRLYSVVDGNEPVANIDPGMVL